MIESVMLVLGYIVAGVLTGSLLYCTVLGLWLYLSRNFVLYYTVIKADKKYGEGVVEKEYKSKPFWKVRLFFSIFSEWNTECNATRYGGGGSWVVRYGGVWVRGKVY